MIKIKELKKSVKNLKDPTKLLNQEGIFFSLISQYFKSNQKKFHLKDISPNKKEKKLKKKDLKKRKDREN